MHNIRPLRESDKKDILEIARHTWEGHDYLPYAFDAWMKDPDSYTAAIEHEGHIIALANLRVIENGRTGWMEGLRVHPDHKGTGLASALTKHIVQIATEIPVERIRYTTATVNETSLHLGQMIGMERKFDLAVHWQEISKEIPKRSLEFDLESVTAAQINTTPIDPGLLPYNVIIYDWKALDATYTGLQDIGQHAAFWVQMRNGIINSLSLGFIREGKNGNMWCFTIYADDESSFLNHLFHHISMTSENKCVSLFITFPTKFNETMRGLDWTQYNEGDDDFALTMLERIF